MANSANEQAGETSLVKLTLAPAAYSAAIRKSIPAGKVGWTSDDHYELVQHILSDLKDENGETADIRPPLAKVLKLIYRPSEDAQREVLRQAFADANYSLDAATENILAMMFSAAQFAGILVDEKLIQKDTGKKRGAKKKTFASLLSSTQVISTDGATTEPTPTEGADGGRGDTEAAETASDELSQQEEQPAPAPQPEAKTIKKPTK